MRRDGAMQSLWQVGMDVYNSKNLSISQDVTDAVIVGGGITGVSTALLLQKSGLKCVLAEAQNLCFGTTGGTTSHLNTFFDSSYEDVIKDFGELDAQLMAASARQALDLIKKHVHEYNIDCGYEEKDGYLYAQDKEQWDELEKIYKASKKAGVEVIYADTIPVPVQFTKAILYKAQAQIHPSKYVYALAKEFEKAGGIILQNCTVTKVEEKGILVVQSSSGEIKTKNVIYATHIPPGVNLLHFRNAPYRSYAMAVTLEDDKYPDALAYDMYDPYHYYRTQTIDGKKYLIVGGEDHKTAHEENTDHCFTKLEAHVRTHFKVDKIVNHWSSQFFEPSDGLAYIGHLPGNPENVYVATGFGGNGITYSHIAAITLHDLIVKGDSDFKEIYDPSRIKMVAGFANFIKESADVVKEFFSKRLAIEKIDGLADLAPGEARLVKYDGKSVALYKDEDGNFHAVNPVCPHAKCVVGWNSAEKSWDCPCHGSRFSITGELLTGPARSDLERIDIH